MSEFNAIDEVAALKRDTQLRRKRRYNKRPSLLDPHRFKLIALRDAGASFTELQQWLKKRKLDVSLSTITRYMKHFG